MKRGRIWFVTRALPAHGPGGMERVAEETAYGLAARGWTVDLITPRPPVPVTPPPGVEIHPLRAPHRRPSARLERALRRWAADRPSPDLLFSPVLSAGVLAASRPDLPALFQAHGASFAEAAVKLRAGDPRGLFRLRLYASAERRHLPRFDRIVAVGPAVRAYFRTRAYRFLDQSRIREIPNGVDLRLFAEEGGERRRRVREEFGVRPEEKAILAACRLIPEKGVGDLLRAYERMDGRERTRLWIAGTGREEKRLRAYAGSRGIGGVRFFGALPRERVIDLAHGADLAVQTGTRPEGLPLLVLESLLAGTPVLVSEGMPLPDFGGGEAVLRARPGDADSIARAAEKGLRLGAPLAGAAAAARERFSLERALDEYERVIFNLSYK